MLLGKEPSKFEVYNDIEGELVNFFRVVKNRPAELLLELDLLPLNSREEFSSWLHFHDGGNEPNIHLADQLEIIDRTTPASLTEEAEKLKTSLRKRSDYRDVRQAAAYLMRVRNSYSSSGRSFACQPFSVRTLFTQILEMSRRLENVIIEQQSFEVLIPHYDREDSFFYGDPPYYDSEYVYDAEFGWDHRTKLVSGPHTTDSGGKISEGDGNCWRGGDGQLYKQTEYRRREAGKGNQHGEESGRVEDRTVHGFHLHQRGHRLALYHRCGRNSHCRGFNSRYLLRTGGSQQRSLLGLRYFRENSHGHSKRYGDGDFFQYAQGQGEDHQDHAGRRQHCGVEV